MSVTFDRNYPSHLRQIACPIAWSHWHQSLQPKSPRNLYLIRLHPHWKIWMYHQSRIHHHLLLWYVHTNRDFLHPKPCPTTCFPQHRFVRSSSLNNLYFQPSDPHQPMSRMCPRLGNPLRITLRLHCIYLPHFLHRYDPTPCCPRHQVWQPSSPCLLGYLEISRQRHWTRMCLQANSPHPKFLWYWQVYPPHSLQMCGPMLEWWKWGCCSPIGLGYRSRQKWEAHWNQSG